MLLYIICIYPTGRTARFIFGAEDMAASGKMTVVNVHDTIIETFELTGFSDILTIEIRN